jgi:hypothetical protein
MKDSQFRVSLDEKGKERAREIQLIINLLAPDPVCQPYYLADEAMVFDIYNQSERIILSRLEGYFGKTFNIDIRQPLWSFVDKVKLAYPGWPDNWDCVDLGLGPELRKME